MDNNIKWLPLNADSLPNSKTGPFLCTNSISARNAFGRMSHVWLVDMFHKSEGPEGPVTAFLADYQKIFGLTHYAVIGVPTSQEKPHVSE
jgi:hypothetical protein